MPAETTATLPPAPRTGQLFEALLAARVDPALAHGAVAEVTHAAGDNVVAQITTHVDARIDTQGAELKAQGAELKARMDTQGAELKAQISEVKAQVGVLEARLEEKINGTNRLLKALITLIAALTGALLMLLGMYIFPDRPAAPAAAPPPAVAPAGNPAPAPVEPESAPESAEPPAG